MFCWQSILVLDRSKWKPKKVFDNINKSIKKCRNGPPCHRNQHFRWLWLLIRSASDKSRPADCSTYADDCCVRATPLSSTTRRPLTSSMHAGSRTDAESVDKIRIIICEWSTWAESIKCLCKTSTFAVGHFRTFELWHFRTFELWRVTDSVSVLQPLKNKSVRRYN